MAEAYPTIQAALRHGTFVPPAVAATAFAFLAYAAWRWNEPAFAVLGVLLGIGLLFLCRLVLELVALLADMLLPK